MVPDHQGNHAHQTLAAMDHSERQNRQVRLGQRLAILEGRYLRRDGQASRPEIFDRRHGRRLPQIRRSGLVRREPRSKNAAEQGGIGTMDLTSLARRLFYPFAFYFFLFPCSLHAFAAKPLGDLTGPWQLFADDYLVASRTRVVRKYYTF